MEKQEITLENILERYKDTAGPGDQQAVIALLREVQQLYGCVPDSVQQRVAQAVGTAPSLIAALVRRVPGLTPAAYRHRIVPARAARQKAGRPFCALWKMPWELPPARPRRTVASGWKPATA